MALPDLSNSMFVARLRYIQSIHEAPEHRNPDTFVRYFMPFKERLRATWISRPELSKLRADPFYYYLIARTRYYDQVLQDAVSDGVQQIVSIGCGSDTRPYRFQQLLSSQDVKVLECDQAQAIQVKERLARRWRSGEQVDYLGIDLNRETWPELDQWLQTRAKVKMLVFMEGVSPYVDRTTFGRFLDLLAGSLLPGSHLAYDYKIRGVKDDFGRGGSIQEPFRLSHDRNEVTKFHHTRGLPLEAMELSSELCARLLPGLAGLVVPWFAEDALLRLRVAGT